MSMRSFQSLAPPRAPWRVAALALGAALAASCMPLPPEQGGGVAVSTGPLSDQWSVVWDPVSRTPLTMTNRSLQDEHPAEIPDISDSAAFEATLQVFRGYREWWRWRLGVDDIRLVRGYSRGWVRFLRIEQLYNGVPVGGGGYDVRVFTGGRVASLEGRFYPEIAIAVAPVLNPQQAEERARAVDPASLATGASLPPLQLEYEHGFAGPIVLVVLPRAADFVLAWGVLVPAPPNGSARIYVDAKNGALLGMQLVGGVWQH